MKRPLLTCLLAAALCVRVSAAEPLATPGTAARMEVAANALLAALPPELKKKAAFGFDDPHRFGWFFTPQQDKHRNYSRLGLPIKEMSAEHRKLAYELLRSAMSPSGFVQASSVIQYEDILKEQEMNGRMVRDTGWYFLSVFGTPAKTGSWGWRLEGHHLSLNFTVVDGKVASAYPLFLGVNPAEIKTGTRTGFRLIREVEDNATALLKSLDAAQLKLAVQAEHYPEVEENTPLAKYPATVGLSASRLTQEQKKLLMALVQSYADRMSPELAATEMERVKAAGEDKLTFGICGDPAPNKLCTYRISGPTFTIEFLRVQNDSLKNPGNHIHSVWRNLPKDFGQ